MLLEVSEWINLISVMSAKQQGQTLNSSEQGTTYVKKKGNEGRLTEDHKYSQRIPGIISQQWKNLSNHLLLKYIEHWNANIGPSLHGWLLWAQTTHSSSSAPSHTAQAQTEALNNAKNDRKPDRPDSQKKPNFCINFQGNPVPRLNLAAQLLPRSM